MSCVVLPPSPTAPGMATFEFGPAGGGAPRHTSMQRIQLPSGSHEEPPDPEHVRFFYVLAGNGVFMAGETRAALRAGSAVVLTEGEGGRFDSAATGLTLLRVAVRPDVASAAAG